MSLVSPVAIAGSYKDPAGFVFSANEGIYRQVNQEYKEQYELIKSSGLFEKLWEKNWLVKHEEVDDIIADERVHYKTLKADKIPFITYPYEWSFLMFQKAAVFTLELQEFCVANGFTLKDATPFNVQFIGTEPIWIDTLSIEKMDISKPWIAYQQFLQTQLYPLLVHESNPSLKFDVLIQNLNGIKADVVSNLLPRKKKFSLSYWMYVYLTKTVGTNSNSNSSSKRNIAFTEQKHLSILSHLKSYVKSLKAPSLKVSWKNYYQDHIETQAYTTEKVRLLNEYISEGNLNEFGLDLGANTGKYSDILHDKNYYVLSSDFDINCIDEYFTQTRQRNRNNIQQFLFDIAHPTPSVGFGNEERESISERLKGKVKITLALALIHHLRVTYNLPLSKVAKYLSSITEELIIEFVPQGDSKFIALTAHREDRFDDYTEEGFEKDFGVYFNLKKKDVIAPSQRILYLFQRK